MDSPSCDVCKPSALFPEVRMTISAGNYNSQVSHWDLQTFIDGQEKPSNNTVAQSEDKSMVREKYTLHDPENLHNPMVIQTLSLPKATQMVNRYIAWSPCGRWCIVVGGDQQSKKGLVNLFERLHATQ